MDLHAEHAQQLNSKIPTDRSIGLASYGFYPTWPPPPAHLSLQCLLPHLSRLFPPSRLGLCLSYRMEEAGNKPKLIVVAPPGHVWDNRKKRGLKA